MNGPAGPPCVLATADNAGTTNRLQLQERCNAEIDETAKKREVLRLAEE
jgi:hypothetical protein